MPVRNRSIRLAAALCLVLWGGTVAAQETGSIAGRVLDSSTGRAIGGASVVIVGTEDGRAETDLEGRFGITDVPVGTYEVRITKPRYGSALIENVEVTAGRQSDMSASLAPRGDSAVEVLEVVADVTESSEATQLLKRKMAPTVSDNLGAESISKTPDSDAAEVVTRVPSVTIKDGSFLVVRGLGDRYNAALMNRSKMPSTDPTRRVVPLDLFPADFIESLTLVKSYTPDLPGDFAGGLLDIRLSDPPLESQGSAGLSLGFNTATTFDDFLTYDGCGWEDWFGFGVGCRELSGDFPADEQIRTLNSIGSDLQQRRMNAALPLNWNLDTKTAPPNFGLDLGYGTTWGPLGVNLAATYGTKHQTVGRIVANSKNSDAFEEISANPYDYMTSTFSTNLGGILTSAYKISNDHRVNLRFLYNRRSQDIAQSGIGFDESQGQLIDATSAIYTADQLIFGQLTSQNRVGPFDVDLGAAVGYTTRDQPDGKFTGRQEEVDEGGFIFQPRFATRFFGELDETLQEYSIDVSLPFTTPIPWIQQWAGKEKLLKMGAAYLFRDRDFKLRIFGYDDNGALNNFDSTTVTPDEYFNPVNFGTGGIDLVPLGNAETDRFKASQEVAAGYLMLDVPLIAEKLRLIGGARFEYSYIFVEGALPDGPFRRPIKDTDVMPAVSLVYSLTDKMNLRAAFSETVSRPEFRELNRALIPTAPGERAFRGNPTLVSSSIRNYDVRWEWFPSSLELMSVSAFYKELDKPIELSAIPAATTVIETRTNAVEATAWGIELESRRNFNFLVPILREWEPIRPYVSFLADVEFLFNFTFVESEVSGLLPVPGFPELIVTNENRALTDQAPFVVNTALQYDHFRWGTFRILYNTVGETIVAAGTTFQQDRTDDIKAQRRDQLDFVWLREWEAFGERFRTKLAVENITNDDYLETQEVSDLQPDGTLEPLGTLITEQYYTGVTFGVSLTYDF